MNELSEFQSKINKNGGNDKTRISKLTNTVTFKDKEIRDLSDEHLKLKTTNDDIGKKMKELNLKASNLEASNIRLESQVDNLI